MSCLSHVFKTSGKSVAIALSIFCHSSWLRISPGFTSEINFVISTSRASERLQSVTLSNANLPFVVVHLSILPFSFRTWIKNFGGPSIVRIERFLQFEFRTSFSIYFYSGLLVLDRDIQLKLACS